MFLSREISAETTLVFIRENDQIFWQLELFISKESIGYIGFEADSFFQGIHKAVKPKALPISPAQ
jgi:hypothetical protein